MFDPVKGKTVPVFFYYSIPSVLSMVALSGAVVIDGMFLGNHAGAHALAAVNLTIPVSTLIIGIALMLAVGGAALCGRYLGRRDTDRANAVFSQTVILTVIIALAATALGLMFTDPLVTLLGGNEAIFQKTREYLRIMMLFFVCQAGIVCLSAFLRVDGRPLFAASVMIAGSLVNVALDWWFIVTLGMGHTGAALGTGLSELITVVALAAPFVMNRTRIRFKGNVPGLSEALKGAFNGFSEFSNEVSAGLLTFVFNWVIMQRMGENGVAAFSVINSIILGGIIINCGISDSIQPVVSKNYGAKKPSRITDFLGISTLAVFAVGLGISLALIVFPHALAGLFIASDDPETLTLATGFMAGIWPIFLLNGINIVFSSYLTAMNRAVHSTAVSLCRNLFLPVLFLLILPGMTGDRSIFIVLPLSELAAFLIGIVLINHNRPEKLVGVEI